VTLVQQVASLKLENASLLVANQEFDRQAKELTRCNQVFLQQNEQFKNDIVALQQQLDWFKRQLFGRKSERRLAIATDNQLCLGELLDVDETPPPPTETIKSYQRRLHLKQPLKDAVLEHGLRFGPTVPVEVIEIANPAIAGLEPSQYEIVAEKVTHRLAQRPGAYVILKYVRKVVKLKSTGKLSCAPAPAAVIDKSYADVSFLAGLLMDKFRYHLPLYRQHQRLLDCGIQMSRGNLTSLVHRTVDLLEPIYYAMLSSILQSKVLTMDETPIKASRLNGKMKTGYFWPVYGDLDEVAFIFANSRASPVVTEVLGSFCGVLVTDGYKVYERYAAKVNGLTHAQCWAHSRRKFEEALSVEPKLAAKALDAIGKLYQHEDDIREQRLAEGKKHAYRAEHSKPMVEGFFTWLAATFKEQVLLPSSPFTVAANYALERQEALTVFLENPNVPIDTNHLERQIRPVAIGRKNWLFCWTEIGARFAGIAHSLIASCRLHGVNPYVYLVDVLQRIDSHPAAEVHRLTPRLWKTEFAEKPLRSDLHRLS